MRRSSMQLLLLMRLVSNATLDSDCKKRCEKSHLDKEVVKCTRQGCLMKYRGYNKREVPVPEEDPITNKKNHKDLYIPCCPKVEGLLSPEETIECEDYRRFERELSRTPVIVNMNFKVNKIFNISLVDDQFDMVAWVEMSWVDPRVELCPCNEINSTWNIKVDNDEVNLWLPDLHIWEARGAKEIRGLTRHWRHIMVAKEKGMRSVIVYGLTFKSTLECHINTTDYPLARNRCFVRFGSLNHDRSKVVFHQNLRFLSDKDECKVQHSRYDIELHGLYEKSKQLEISLMKLKTKGGEEEKTYFAYDGFQIVIYEKVTGVEVQYFVTMLTLVSVALLGVFCLSGYSNPIDRASLFSMVLLGSALLLVQITSNTPDVDNPIMFFIEISTGTILVCFALYCCLVRLTADGTITGLTQFKIELVALMTLSSSFILWFAIYVA